MDTPSKNMYHFVWNDDDEQPLAEEQQMSPKDRVAKILRETELGDIPDLVFRNSKKDSKKGRGIDKKSHQPLKNESELFSIDDDDDYGEDDFVFKGGRLDINDNRSSNKEITQTKNTPTKEFQNRKPAKVPPIVKKSHPKIPLKANDDDAKIEHADTYIDESMKPTGQEFTSGEQALSTKTDSNTAALLPMDSKFLEMDFDDDVDSGVAIDGDTEQHQDTIPIVTVDQLELNERWRKRKQRINFAVAFLLLFVGLTVLIVAIVLIVKMVQA